MPITQQNREIEIITPLGADVLLLRDMNVNEELGRLFTINLELNSTENIQFEDLLGQNVTIRLDRPNGRRFFNGYVGSISQSGDQGHYSVYQATVHPWLWFLTRTADCRIFQQLTVPDIVKQVFRDLGFTDFEDKLNATYRTWDYCVQYRETDFNFVSRLMEQEGIYYYFTHELGKHILNLADAYGSHEVIPDYEEIPYYPPDDVAVRDEECISSIYISTQLQPGTYALNDYDFTRPRADLNTNSNVQHEHSQSKYEVYDYPGEYTVTDDGNNYARTRIEELHTQYEQVQGQSIVRGLLCGGLFNLTNYPRDDQNREYLVVSVNHNVHAESFEAGESGGATNYTNNFIVIDSNTPFRPSRSSFKPVVQGPQTAVVVGPAGDEIYTDEHGRVKLQFHWDRYGESNENSSCWIRVSQVHAGQGFGGIDTPRIGEEVIVSFEEGDPDRPLVTGRVYNGDNSPPNGLPAAKMVSGMKTNSTPGGGGYNGVMLDDTKGKEGFTEHAQYNMDTTVENDRSATVVGGNDAITVEAGTRSVTVKGDTSLTVQAGARTVSVTGGDFSATASAAVMLHGKGAGVGITGDAEGVGITGNGKGVGIIGNGQGVGITGNGKGVGITGNGDGVSVKGTPDVFIDGNSNITIKSPVVDIGDNEININGNKIVMAAGGGSIVIDAAGVTIQGPLVKIN